MKITDKINFRQPKYTLPAVLYPLLLFVGYFIFNFSNIEPADVGSKMQATEYYNDKLPDANLKGDGIGDKYSNMLNNFGKIKDGSAVENIERDDEDQKEEYHSQYSDAEIAAMDRQSEEAKKSMERLQKLQDEIKSRQPGQERQEEEQDTRSRKGNTDDEERTLEELRKALAEARNERAQYTGSVTSGTDDGTDNSRTDTQEKGKKCKGNGKGNDSEKAANGKSVREISEDARAEEVVRKHRVTSDYFNTIASNESQSRLIRAIVDEDIKAVDGSRIRLRLLDDIDIGDRTIAKGSYLYCTLNGFGQQRVKGSVTSVLVGDELVRVSLSIYDTDGLEGLYVPKSSFTETTKDIVSEAVGQNMTITDGSTSSTTGRWGSQVLQNAYQKAANALSKSIRKNRVKVKYGTQVYLINSKQKSK